MQNAENLSKADVIKKICSTNVKESNLFLRKLYSELSKYDKLAWNYFGVREKQKICLGICNLGEVWIDYKVKGLIDSIYVFTNNDISKESVQKAVDEAFINHLKKEKYTAIANFHTKDISFKNMCKKNIEIKSEEKNGKFITSITFSFEAFSGVDAEYIHTQKLNYLKHLLFAYTNIKFENIENYIINDNELKYEEKDWVEFDRDWIDYYFDEHIGPQNTVLLYDFFDIFRIVLDNDTYNKEMRLVLNAAQELYCGKLMIDNILTNGEYNIPGYVDITNTIILSVLEPLSNIRAEKPEHCPSCGNLVYKIRKKVEVLCNTYLNDWLTKYISDIKYGQRSTFLHEGNALTNEFYSGRCIPLINPSKPNTLLPPTTTINFNMINYVSYIFRHVVRDILDKIDLQ